VLEIGRDVLRQKLHGYLERDPRLRSVAEYTKRRFEAATALTAHNWEHIYRDVLNAIVIGEAEGADMSVVLPAIVMHDIGYLYGAGKDHAARGALELPAYLDEAGISYSDDEIGKLARCIGTHKGSSWDQHPEGLEAEVVADADLLDKFGAIGTYQQIRAWNEFSWSLGKVVQFGNGTIIGLTLDTDTGRRLAEPGRQLIVDFFRELAREAEPYADPSLDLSMPVQDRNVVRVKLRDYLERDPRLRSVATYTKERFDAATALTAHNWEHIYRDMLNAIVVGEAERADMDIVLSAIVMHDIGYLYGGGKDHGARGADRLPEYLDEAGISYSADEIMKLASCIRTHKGSGWDKHPEGLEAKVVADADLLDKFGALGTYQHIRACSEFNWSLAKIVGYNETMSGLALDTATARRLAEPGRQLMVDFLCELAREAEPYLDPSI
jgi:HD superfamily phosphodiesterase